MSTELRELVASLAVHGRPIQRVLFERLALVSTDTIDRARDLALVELHGGQLSLPSPWYGEVQRLDPAARHRLLAEAFAGTARSERGEASPLAVLEAHRHYAAIPDIEREARLNARLARGWKTERLWADGLPAVDADPPVQVRAMPLAEEACWECVAGELRRRGATRVDAVRGLVRALIFDVLATRWRRETGALSITRLRYEHPAWHQILTLGPEVVPEILRRIERQPDHWHEALVQLTGENPFPAGERITVSQVCARWVAWGRERGLRW